MKLKKTLNKKGFTLIELVVVITIIAILTILTVVAYKGISANALDKSVQSDVDNFTTAETNYALHNSGTPLAYYSGDGYSSALGVSVSNGNYIDIVANSTDFCIRGWNPSANKNSPTNAYTYESTPGACTSLPASSQADANYPPTSWVSVAVGQQYECGIASNQKAYCWGLNSSGQLGNGTTTSSDIPVPVTTSGVLNGLTILALTAGSNQTCAIASDNNAYCWGDNSNGELGNGTTTSSNVPVAVSTAGVLSGKTILSISTGTEDTCAIASDNNAYCWGDNSTGALGDNLSPNSDVPVAVYTAGVLSGKTVKSIQAANLRACLLASDNEVYCFGADNYGQLGNNAMSTQRAPVAVYTGGVLSGKTILALAQGVDSHSCVIASDNQAYCWGLNSNGQLGNNSTTNSDVPTAVFNTGVLSGKYMLTISTGSGNTCVVASDNEPYCWGVGVQGELGNGTSPSSQTTPVAVTVSGALSGKSLITTQVGQTDICTIASNAQNYCWGDNTNGQLGNGNNTNSNVPSLVSLPAS